MNASLQNLETQVGQLALKMQNQSKDTFPRDTRKNLKDCMVVTLRIGRKIESRKEVEKKKIEKVKGEESGKQNKLSNLDVVEKTEKEEVQTKKQVDREDLKKKEDKQAYFLVVPFP